MVDDELEKLDGSEGQRIRVQSYQRGDGTTSLQAKKHHGDILEC